MSVGVIVNSIRLIKRLFMEKKDEHSKMCYENNIEDWSFIKHGKNLKYVKSSCDNCDNINCRFRTSNISM